jgi:ankyrin repeat protein
LCAEYGRVDLFKWFKKQYDMDIKINNNSGESPLMIACREGKKSIVMLYLTEYKGQFMADKKSKDEWTILFYAAYNGHASIVELILT